MMDAENTNLFQAIKEIITQARQQIFRQANSALLESYWHIGRLILEEEQSRKIRAQYGEETLKKLTNQLNIEFGKGFDYTNLTNMRRFYQAFPIFDAVRQELSWTHYRLLCRIDEVEKKQYYAEQSIVNNWNTRTLQWQINSQPGIQAPTQEGIAALKHNPAKTQNAAKKPEMATVRWVV